MGWNFRCKESIRRERAEVEAKYNIRIGQTEIKCGLCGKPWGYGKHTCQNIRFQQLKEAKKVRTPIPPDRFEDLNVSCTA